MAADPKTESASAETEPDSAVTYLRITQSKSAAAGLVPDASAVSGRSPARRHDFPTDIFQFSALSDISAVPQREQKVNSYLLSEIASRLTKSDPSVPGQRERQGYFFTNLVIPDDFAKLIEGPANVTLEVDETTAAYPWEMAGCRKIAGALPSSGPMSQCPVSSAPCFRPRRRRRRRSTIRSTSLIIADPAFGDGLPGARKEAEAVVEVLQRAQNAWGANTR